HSPTVILFTPRPPPRATLFPYTTLFRSIGGIAQVVGLNNPPYELLPEVCERQSAMYLRVAAMAPSLEMEVRVAQGRLEIEVANSDRKSTRLNSSHLGISYAVFCLKKKKK